MTYARRGVTPSGLAYSVTGSGPPLLWLSGFVLDSSALDPFVAQFADDYTCIVFDARGSGRTRPSVRVLTTARMAADALEVLKHLGHESAHVHGVSLGGMVAQELAIRAPHRVRTLVLGSTTAGGWAATPASLSTMWSSVFDPHAPVPGAESVSWRGAVQQALAASTHDAVSRLRRVQAPTLVMHGARDRLLPPGNAKALAALIPGAELQLVPRAGHFYPMHSAVEAAAVALQWMKTQGDVQPAAGSSHRQCAHLVQDLVSAPVRWTRARLMPIRHVYTVVRPRPAARRRHPGRS